MAKIAIIGDIHLNPKSINTTIKNKVVAGQKAFLASLPAELKSRGIDTVLFAGDVFDNRNFCTNDTMNYALTLFGETFKDFNVHIISGNHDMLYEDVPDVCWLKALSSLPNVTTYIDSIGKLDLLGKTWYMVPWVFPRDFENVNEWLLKMSKKTKAVHDNTVIFGHFDMYGMLMEAGQIAESGFDPSKFFAAAKYVFSGHYHCKSETEEKGNRIIYVGSPYHLSFAHVETDCGYYIVDDEMNIEFVENTMCPRFMDVDDEHLDNLGDLSGMFVRYYTLNTRNTDEAMLRKKKLEAANPIFIKNIPYGEAVGGIENAKKLDDDEAKKILSTDSFGLAAMYMDKNSAELPTLHSGVDAREEVLRYLHEYTLKSK